MILLAHPEPVRSHCATHACWQRVHRRRVIAYLWRHYKAHPMPWCTWAPESGTALPEFGRRRYRVRNASSTAAGKFQILDSTWHAIGGRDYPGAYDAAQAPPLEQEKRARILLRVQGLRAWARC